MSYFEMTLPTTIDLFHYRFEDLLGAFAWPGVNQVAFTSMPPSRARAYYQFEFLEFEQSQYEFIRWTGARTGGMLISITAAQYLPDETLVTVHYDSGVESEQLFAARLVDWLQTRFNAVPTRPMQALDETIEWYKHCGERDEAKREHGTPYDDFDNARGKDPRTARRWCKKFADQGLL